MNILTILFIILAIVVIFLLLFAIGLYIYITKPKRVTHEEARGIELSKDFMGDFDLYEKEELNITARDGYVLHGLFIPFEKETNKLAIVTHGYTYNYEGSVKYANIFKSLGYSVYIYDIRHHGLNKKTYCSMSRTEAKDVEDVYHYFREKYGKDMIIGLHGESLGSASSITALANCKDADFLVADCGFADFGLLAEYLAAFLLPFKVPAWMSHLASIISVLCHGFRLDKLRPIDSLMENETTPVFFIHGEKDSFIPNIHSQMMYEVCRAPKQISLFPEAEHAQSFQFDRERYYKEVKEFLDKVL